ncbi:MAG: pseudouridine synthase [Patescibacteria group bacterium]
MLIRLQKYLADRGVASRRKCEEYIASGLIKVNGKVIKEMGVKVDPENDKIDVDPTLQMREQNFIYYALHKPVGYVCSVTGPEEPKIMELLKGISERVFPVGRLDKLTAGLLIVTNDGRFAYEMTHPKFEKEKEYVVKLREKVDSAALLALRQTFFIHGRRTQPATVTQQSPHLLHIILREGRNRQIRRMCEKANLHIEKLKRIRIGKLMLGDLEPKEYRKLTPRELELLRA